MGEGVEMEGRRRGKGVKGMWGRGKGDGGRGTG